ncbi:hypothetical protein EDC04DRAFT_2608636 [Pisolithus marmoratus]|nr:hypothetical protein EDC04DRAFT_2608636 [Pisolithus marmoratus]
MDSKHDEQAVEDAVQDTLEADSHIPDMCNLPSATIPHPTPHILDTVTHPSHEGVSMDGQDIDDQDATDADTEDNLDNGLAEGSDSDCIGQGFIDKEDGSGVDEQPQIHKPEIANEYGKSLRLIMIAAGLTMKATQAELIWNMHQAWYAGTHSKQSGVLEVECDWCKGHGLESHGRAQMWCNVEGIHIFSCVIYSRNDEAAWQAQDIFAGSQLCMQLASERQTDVVRLMDFLTTIIKYKALDLAAEVPLLNFASMSHVSYDHNLTLQLQESRQNCNYEVGIIHGQKNVPWRTLLDLLYLHQYTLVDWPAGVCAIGADFNVKCLNANELHSLTVPFLKEEMGANYLLEAPLDNDEDEDDVADEGLVPVPGSSFYLADWTSGIFTSMEHNVLELTNQPEQLEVFRNADPKMVDIPLFINTFHQPLHLLSDSQAFLKGLPENMDRPPADNASPSLPSPLPPSSPLP